MTPPGNYILYLFSVKDTWCWLGCETLIASQHSSLLGRELLPRFILRVTPAGCKCDMVRRFWESEQHKELEVYAVSFLRTWDPQRVAPPSTYSKEENLGHSALLKPDRKRHGRENHNLILPFPIQNKCVMVLVSCLTNRHETYQSREQEQM